MKIVIAPPEAGAMAKKFTAAEIDALLRARLADEKPGDAAAPLQQQQEGAHEQGEDDHPGVIGITEDIDQALDGRGGAAERVAAGGDNPADPDPRS